MDVAKSRKTTRVLYLYLTIPLIILTAVFGMIALMTRTKDAAAPRPESAAPVRPDAGPEAAGSSWAGRRPSVELAPLDEHASGKDEVKSSGSKESTAGNAAIVTAIMGGLTGLMGAMTQTFMAFLKMRDRRRHRSNDEETGETLPDDQEHG
jgi:energy-converting hydrogenase Eha subunit A